jgi:hypothetical protein
VPESEGWTVPCVDGAGRPRSLTARVETDGVHLHWPAGQAAVLTERQVAELRSVLEQAERTMKRNEPGAD